MNGVHDMGGMHGMGPIAPEPNEPVFHERWEARVYALNRAMGFLGKWNIDAGRHSRERIPPADYLRMSYYEKWLAGLMTLLQESGLATEVELESGRPSPGTVKAAPALTYEKVAEVVAARGTFERPVNTPPRFAVGERVRARKLNPTGHTRLPRYARGAIWGCRPYPWRPRVPRHQRPFSRREPSASLFGADHRARIVGRGGGRARRRLHRPVGRLS